MVVSVRATIDVYSAGTANALAAIVVEVDRFGALVDQALVDDVEHLEKRGVVRDCGRVVGFDPAFAVRTGLAPDF